MKLFRNYSMSWWQVGLLKLYVMVVGLMVGSYFAEYILPYMSLLLVIFVLLAIYFSYQMFTNGFKDRGEM